MSNIQNDPLQYQCRTVDKAVFRGRNPTSGISTSGVSTSASCLAALLASVGAESTSGSTNDVSADSILEEHLSRVWEDGCESGAVKIPLFYRSVTSQLDASEAETKMVPVARSSFCRLPQDPGRTTQAGNSTSTRINHSIERSLTTFPDSSGKMYGVKPLGRFFGSIPDDSFHRSADETIHSRGIAAPRTNSIWSVHPVGIAQRNKITEDHNVTTDSYLSTAWCRVERNPAAVDVDFGSRPCCATSTDVTIVGYYLCEDPIPYRTTLPGKHPTLGQFKQLVTKKGNLRFFFRKASDEFESGVVHEEITDDRAILPHWEGKIVGKIELIQ